MKRRLSNTPYLFLILSVIATLLTGCAGPAPTPGLPVSPANTPIPPAAAATNPPATATTAPVPTSQPQPEAIKFAPGAVMAQVPVNLQPGASRIFVFGALKGQLVTVELSVSADQNAAVPATFSLTGADGSLLTAGDTTRWKAALTVSQDYTIVVKSQSDQALNLTLLLAIPAIGSTPYVPVTAEVCQMLQEMANQALSVSFSMQANTPFEDFITGETGLGCTLTFKGSAVNLPEQLDISTNLRNGFPGFSELPAYLASGPSGEAFALTRDSAVLLISAGWQPDPAANCPADQPISACDLKPEQKLYTITIQAAMK